MNATVILTTSKETRYRDLIDVSGKEFLCDYVFGYFPKVERDAAKYEFTFGFKQIRGGRKIKMKTIRESEKYFANRNFMGEGYYCLFESFVSSIQNLARENSIVLSEEKEYAIWVKLEEA